MEWNADHRLSKKRKAYTVLAQYSFDLRRRLWNTILGITWKIIMAELMVALSALGLVIIRRLRRREKVVCPFHTPHWFASTPRIRMVIEQTTNQSIQWRPILRQPTFSDFACCIGVDNIRAAPKASNNAEHTEQFPKSFQSPETRQTANGWAGVFLLSAFLSDTFSVHCFVQLLF